MHRPGSPGLTPTQAGLALPRWLWEVPQVVQQVAEAQLVAEAQQAVEAQRLAEVPQAAELAPVGPRAPGSAPARQVLPVVEGVHGEALASPSPFRRQMPSPTTISNPWTIPLVVFSSPYTRRNYGRLPPQKTALSAPCREYTDGPLLCQP